MEQIESKIISELSSSLELDLVASKSIDELKSALTDHINYLINHDFNKLVSLLYRIDISEKSLRSKLDEKGIDAAAIIAEMIVQRQIQKIRTREQFRANDNIPDDEKW